MQTCTKNEYWMGGKATAASVQYNCNLKSSNVSLFYSFELW